MDPFPIQGFHYSSPFPRKVNPGDGDPPKFLKEFVVYRLIAFVLALSITVGYVPYTLLDVSFNYSYMPDSVRKDFSSYDASVSYYANYVGDGSTFSPIALYILSDLYTNHYNELSSSSISTIQSKCNMNVITASLRKFVIAGIFSIKDIVEADKIDSTYVTTLFSNIRNNVSNALAWDDIQTCYYFLQPFISGTVSGSEAKDVQLPNAIVKSIRETDLSISPFGYFYSAEGYYGLMSLLLGSASAAQYSKAKAIIDNLVNSHPDVYFYVQKGGYGFNEIVIFVFEYNEGSFIKRTLNSNNLYLYDLNWNQILFDDLSPYKYYHRIYIPLELGSNQLLNAIGEDNVYDIDGFNTSDPLYDLVFPVNTSWDTSYQFNILTSQESVWGMYHQSYSDWTYYGTFYNGGVGPATFGKRAHIYFNSLSDFKNWTLGLHSVYISSNIGDGYIKNVTQNYDQNEYYYNYITNNTVDMDPEELQRFVDQVINSIDNIGDDVEENTNELKSIKHIIEAWFAAWLIRDPSGEEASSDDPSLKDLLLPLLYVIMMIFVLIKALGLVVALGDYLLHIFGVPATIAGLHEDFVRAINFLKGTLPETDDFHNFYIMSIGNYHMSCMDFMIILFELAFIGMAVSLIRKYTEKISIPEVR